MPETRDPSESPAAVGTADIPDEIVELMRAGAEGVMSAADPILASHSLARAHHRILSHVRRKPGVTVGDLQTSLGVSAQALHRPMKQLLEAALITTVRDSANHRFKALHLTEGGERIEKAATDTQRQVVVEALDQLGEPVVDAWKKVMRRVAGKK